MPRHESGHCGAPKAEATHVRPLCCSLVVAFAAVLAAGIAPVAQAQHPAKPIRLIVPSPPGGSSDTLSRTLAPGLSEALGRQMVIDDRPGAGAGIRVE